MLVRLGCGISRLSLRFSWLRLRLCTVVIAVTESFRSSHHILGIFETLLSTRLEEFEEMISRICK